MSQEWGLRLKIWLECDGKPVLGDGRLKMLRAIDRNGSMKQAADETGISYRKMRGAIRDMEISAGYPFVRIQRGGGGGGGATLTPEARTLMQTFEKLSNGFADNANARFEKLSDFFSQPNGRMCHSNQKGDIPHETLR